MRCEMGVRSWVVALTVAVAACSSGGGGDRPEADPAATSRLAADASGVLQAAAQVTLGGSTLTLPAGTTLTVYENGVPAAPPPSLADATLTLSTPPGDGPALPSGATRLARFRIGLTVGGVERAARFSGPAAGGPSLTVRVPPAVGDTLALLFDVSSGTPAFLGTAPVVASTGASAAALKGATGLRAAASTGDGTATLSPTGTGDVDVATTNGSSGGGSGSGPYWTTYQVPAAPCVNVGGAQVCGPTYIRNIDIDEPSTTDIMGSCWPGRAGHATTGVLSPGFQYWCDVSAGPNGSTLVTISGTAANLPIISLAQVRLEDNLPLSFDVVPAAEGLHAPDGSVRTDPYTEKDWKYGASKILTCKAKGKDINWLAKHAYQPLVDAGYDVQRRLFRMEGGYATEDYSITETLDGRLKIGATLQAKGWRQVSASGNVGTYEYKGLSKLVLHSVITGAGGGASYSGTLDATVDLTADESGVYSGKASMSLTGYTFSDSNVSGDCSLSIGPVSADALDVTALTYSESTQGDGTPTVEASVTVYPFTTYETQTVTCRGVSGSLVNHLIGGSFAAIHQGELGGSGWVVTGGWEPGDGSTIAATKTMSGSATSGDTTAQEQTKIELYY